MRLGPKRRIHIRVSRVGKQKITVFLSVLSLVGIFVFSSVYFLHIVRPVMLTIAKNQAHVLAEQAIERAANRVFSQSKFEDFVSISQDAEGAVTSLSTNMQKVTRLKAEASLAIQKELSELSETKIFIPWGTLTGYDLLAGLGPHLGVALVPYGRVAVAFESDFKEAGINQTRLAVNLKATATVGLILPSEKVQSEITSTLPVAETVIVGDVPDSYVNIDRLGEEYESDVLDVIG